jgi:hypothetical protein
MSIDVAQRHAILHPREVDEVQVEFRFHPFAEATPLKPGP